MYNKSKSIFENIFDSNDNKIDIEFLEHIEHHLIKSGVYIDCVSEIMNYLVKKTINKKSDRRILLELLKEKIVSIVNQCAKSIEIDNEKKPNIILVCGINGSGKTTLIGKMAYLLSQTQWKITIAACDTFRSAASEQLELCTKFDHIEVVKQDLTDGTVSNPHSVLMKALSVCKKNNHDVLIVDTSGRLHNNKNLMKELSRMYKKLQQINMPYYTVLVLDANCGYNAINQVTMFNEAVKLNGLVLTKVDIAQKIGFVLSICHKFKLPIYSISYGEDKHNLGSFNPFIFTENMLIGIDLNYSSKDKS